MPLPTTHVIFNCAIFYLFRKNLGKYWLPFAILSGLLPDFDFVIQYIFDLFGKNSGMLGHGGFFHSLGFVLLIGIVSWIIYAKNKDYGKYGFILAIGVALHILLDYILGGGAYMLTLFYPFSMHQFRLHLLEYWRNNDIYGILDAFMILCVFVWIWFKIKVQKTHHRYMFD